MRAEALASLRRTLRPPSARMDEPPTQPAASNAPSPAELAAWATRAARGDEQAFHALEQRLRGPMRRLFLDRCGGKADLADDLAQRALLGLWQALSAGRYDAAKSQITTFAYAVAHKVWLQQVRAAGRREAAVERYTRLVVGAAPSAVSPEHEGEFAQLVQVIRDLVSDRPGAGAPDLTEQERWLVRSWALGESDRVLARKLGIAPSNVNVRKQVAYAKIRAHLGSLGYLAAPEREGPTGEQTGGRTADA